jgi:hypothetical protein
MAMCVVDSYAASSSAVASSSAAARMFEHASRTRSSSDSTEAERPLGHKPIELERGSTSFKIWRKTIKRKRIRMPDILCLECSRRFESRGKTDLAISMSHSTTDAQRAWDAGLADTDFVALIPVVHSDDVDNPADWIALDPVQYISVSDLRAAYANGNVSISERKGVEEGSEIRVTWPAAIASDSGVVESVTGKSMVLRFESGKRGHVLLQRARGPLQPLISEGRQFSALEIIAAGVPVTRRCACAGGATVDTYLEKVTSLSLTDRYMVVKALKHFDSPAAVDALKDRLVDASEDIYVQVEAAASLVAKDDGTGAAFLDHLLLQDHASYRLEAAIVLGDVANRTSASLLRRTHETRRTSGRQGRCGMVAWGDRTR